MSKYTYKEINEIMKYTPKELDGKCIEDENEFGYGDRYHIGHFTSQGNNWSYQVYIIKYKDSLRPVVTIFGYIRSKMNEE